MKKIMFITSLWCPSCIVMRGRYETFFKEKQLELVEYDYDEDIEQFEHYDIGRVLPVLILVKENGNYTKMIGEKTKKEIAKLFTEFIDAKN